MTTTPGAAATAARSPLWVRGVDRVTSAAARVAAVCTILMALHVIADVTGRFVFGRPLPATLEFVGYGWMPVIVFLALADAQRKNEHLRVTLSVERLPDGRRRVTDTIAFLVTAVVLAAMILYTTRNGIRAVEIQEAKPAVVYVPIWPFRLVVVLGLILMLAQTVVSIWRIAIGERIRDASESERGVLDRIEREATDGRAG